MLIYQLFVSAGSFCNLFFQKHISQLLFYHYTKFEFITAHLRFITAHIGYHCLLNRLSNYHLIVLPIIRNIKLSQLMSRKNDKMPKTAGGKNLCCHIDF